MRYRRSTAEGAEELFSGTVDRGFVSPCAQHSSDRLLRSGVVLDNDDKRHGSLLNTAE